MRRLLAVLLVLFMTTARAAGILPGTLPASYEGELPCADCAGIRYHLDVLSDGTYSLRSEYADRPPLPDTVGQWTVSADGSRLILSGGRSGPLGFAVEGPATLRWLKREGQGFAGPGKYTLTRTATFRPIEPRKTQVGLEDTHWKLVVLGAKPVVLKAKQAEPHLILHAQDHRVAGNAGCNRMMGAYTRDGDKIEFGRMATTMMACLAGMDIERDHLAALKKVETWRIDGDRLDLFDAEGKRAARYEARTP